MVSAKETVTQVLDFWMELVNAQLVMTQVVVIVELTITPVINAKMDSYFSKKNAPNVNSKIAIHVLLARQVYFAKFAKSDSKKKASSWMLFA